MGLRNPLSTLVLLLLFSIPVFRANAQTIKNFSSVGGKKDLGVKCIAQSREGFLWMGTREGLVRFNGKNSRFYKKEDGLSDNDVTAVFADSKSRIWAGHSSGKISFVVNDKADSFKLNKKLPGNEILNFFENKSGTIYIATHGSGVFIWDGKKLDSLNSQNGLSDDIIYSMAWDGKNSLWLGTDAGINIIDLTTKKIKHIGTKNGLPDNIVRCIRYSGDGKMLVGMQDSGLCFFDVATVGILKNPFLSSWNLGAVTSIENTNDGKLIIGTESKGLIMIHDGRIKIVDASNGLLSNAVSKLFIDRERSVWVGTSRGLSMLYQQRHNFMNSGVGLPSDKISCVFADSYETVWAGSDKGLSELMLDETGNLKVKNLMQDIAKSGVQFSCMMPADNGRLLLGTYGSGIMLLDEESGKSNRLATANVPSNENISFICKDAAGNFWVSTLGGGIMVLDKNGISIRKYSEEANGLGSDYVYQVFIDSKQRVWAAVDGGALQLLQGEMFISFKDKLKLQSKTVYSVTEDKNGSIWFVTSDDGVVKFNGKEAEIFTAKNGLRDPVPSIITAVGNKVLCIHNKGIDLIEKGHDPLITYFDIAENDLEPNLNAVFNDKRGDTWLGTNNGVVKFRAYNLPADTITPAAYISKLKVDYNDYALDSTNELDHNQNNLIFEFDANWLKAPDKIKFRYMLAGMEETWQQITGGKMATYNNIRPGEYEFKVEACNEEGVWGRPAIYKFSIATPIWQRWWFWFLAAGIVITAVYFFMRFRLKALQKQNLVLEQKVNERTAEIVEQNKVIEEKNKELEQLSLVASKTENVVLIMDSEGTIEYINDSFTKLNGLTLNELVAERGPTIYDVSNNPKIRSIISEAVRDKKSVVYESLNILKDGSKVWESSTLTPIFEESGALKKLIIIDTDVTERKRQEEIIMQKNRDITDSITYAQKIQTAILPDISIIKEDIPNSFVLYLIKDIVSGDFYWYSQKDGAGIIAAVDCTGHGVPGAFMSMIGYNLLNQIVNERNITEPAKILTELNKGVLKALHKKNPEAATRDGMDVAICKVNSKTHSVEYAGAMRPLWIITEGADGTKDLREIKADKVPIGTLPENEQYHVYHNHVISAKENESYYVFTDGYADQFGGEKGKKLTTGRFKELLLAINAESPEGKQNKLLQHHLSWKAEHEQVDDILVIGFKA